MQIPHGKLFNFAIFLNLLALLALPQLNNTHYDPLPQFWSETTFAWATISLFLLICYFVKTIRIPVIIIPLTFFGIYLCLQQYIVNIDFIGLSYTAALEMLICILVTICFATLREHFGLEHLLTLICISIIIGAMLQSIIGLLQYTGLYKYFGDWVFYDSAAPRTNIFGHFGQRNHYSHYLTWAIFSLMYLFRKHKINLPLFAVFGSWLIFSITIASSRSVFIYFGTGLIISFIYYLRSKRSKESLYLLLTIFLTSLALIVFQYLYPEIVKLFTNLHPVNSGLQRLALESTNGGIAGRRMTEWHKAWIIFKQHPLFGYGWNEYAKQSIYLQMLFPHALTNDGLFTNCHNLILQLLAETGIIGTFIVVLGIMYNIINIFRLKSLESIIILCMIFTTLDHSMVEYPLWYLYFLGPLVMFLSLDKALFKLNSNIVSGISIIPLCYLIYLMLNSSGTFNTLVNYTDVPAVQKSFTKQALYLQKLIDNNLLWAYPATYTLDNYINIDNPNTNMTFDITQQLQYENRLANFHPYPDNMIAQAKLYWKLGNKDQARKYVNLALVAFPVYKNNYLKSLNNAHYKELYEIANKYTYSINK